MNHNNQMQVINTTWLYFHKNSIQFFQKKHCKSIYVRGMMLGMGYIKDEFIKN